MRYCGSGLNNDVYNAYFKASKLITPTICRCRILKNLYSFNSRKRPSFCLLQSIPCGIFRFLGNCSSGLSLYLTIAQIPEKQNTVVQPCVLIVILHKALRYSGTQNYISVSCDSNGREKAFFLITPPPSPFFLIYLILLIMFLNETKFLLNT